VGIAHPEYPAKVIEQPRYTLPARILHWVVGVLVLCQITLGFVTDASEGTQAISLRQIHAEVGILLLALMVLRVSWRFATPPPPLPPAIVPWNRAVAHATHMLLYLIVFAMLFSGIGLWMWIVRPLEMFGLVSISLPDLSGQDEFWQSVAGYAHEFGAFAISALVIAHIAGALWHEFVLRDRLIRNRML